MSKIIILIATTVIAVNLISTILPSGGYEKYCKYIFGLVLVLIFASSVSEFDISSEILDVENIPVFENTKITETVQEQTEEIVNENIINMLKSNRISVKSVEANLEGSEVKEVKVKLLNESLKDEVISLVASYCDIKTDYVMIE